MTRLVLKDPLLDFQVLRAAGSAPYGGADSGECVATGRRTTPAIWAARTASGPQRGGPPRASAARAEAAGKRETARLAYWRASSYYRTAGVMLPARAAALSCRQRAQRRDSAG